MFAVPDSVSMPEKAPPDFIHRALGQAVYRSRPGLDFSQPATLAPSICYPVRGLEGWLVMAAKVAGLSQMM